VLFEKSEMIEARRHTRYELEVPGFMRILGPPGGAFVVTVLDISKSGFRVRSSRPLPEGTSVAVTCRRKEITGEVRYARTMGTGEVHLGIQATGVSGMTGELDLTLLFPDLIRR
jgi:PilZ domain